MKKNTTQHIYETAPNSMGLIFNEGITFEEWEKETKSLIELYKRSQWLVGDALNAGEAMFGDKYAQIADQTGFETSSLYNFAWVCSAIEVERRREKLSFGHHKVIAAFEPKIQDKWMDKAIEENWSVEELRQEVSKSKAKEAGKSVEASDAVTAMDVILKFKTEMSKYSDIKEDHDLWLKMRQVFYGTIFDIEEMMLWNRDEFKKEMDSEALDFVKND